MIEEQEFTESLPLAEWLEQYSANRVVQESLPSDISMETLEPLIFNFIRADNEFELNQFENDVSSIIEEILTDNGEN